MGGGATPLSGGNVGGGTLHVVRSGAGAGAGMDAADVGTRQRHVRATAEAGGARPPFDTDSKRARLSVRQMRLSEQNQLSHLMVDRLHVARLLGKRVYIRSIVQDPASQQYSLALTKTESAFAKTFWTCETIKQSFNNER